MSYIDAHLRNESLTSVAKELGFSVTYCRISDEWTLSSGHGDSYQSYTGMRSTVCAFLAGYIAMRGKAISMLRDIDRATDSAIASARERL